MKALFVILLIIIAPPALAGFVFGAAGAFYALGVMLILFACWGIWMSLVSPLQLQPIPAISFVVGFLVILATAIAT